MREKPWLAHYGALPAQLPDGPQDMLALFRTAVASRSDAEAICYFDARWTWADFDRESDVVAQRLARAGVGRGDHLGVILQNVPQAAVAFVAAWKLGAVPVPGNPMYRAGELAKIFADYRPRAVVAHDDHATVIMDALTHAGTPDVPVFVTSARARQSVNDARVLPPATQRPIGTIDLDQAVEQASDAVPPPDPGLAPDDVGLILYTSGTTGDPKGAVMTHASLAFNSRNAALWFGIDGESRILALAPMFHITGFILHLGLAIAAGASQALHYRFDPGVVVETARNYRPTFTIAAITAFNALMHYPGASAADFACFTHVCSGGAPIAPTLRDSIAHRLGITLSPVYGMTETTSPTHAVPIGMTPPVDTASGAFSVGIPISSTEAQIVDEQGRVLPPGQAGEIWMRGPQIMRGYLNKPSQTAEALHEGWMRSGDIGFMDPEGWFYIVDRKKDMINASGFKVWPREVEDALYAHAAVREAAVVGFADPYRGESVAAFISLRDGMVADGETLMKHCRERLASYKVPRRIEFLDDLPKTSTGKIQRAMLKGDRAGSSCKRSGSRSKLELRR